MITLFVEENNPLTPTFYDSFIADLQFHQLRCPCGQAGSLSVHGYYQRFIKMSNGKLCFNIYRIICDSIDVSTIRHVIVNYRRHWKQRLISHSISITSVPALIKQCFIVYSRQFMQIRPTITIKKVSQRVSTRNEQNKI